jgi:hypothetical protein
MEMAAEGALLVSPNLGSCAIDPTFTAEVEQRTVKEVRVYKELYFSLLTTEYSLINSRHVNDTIQH